MKPETKSPARPLRALLAGLMLWIAGRAVFVWADAEPTRDLVAGDLDLKTGAATASDSTPSAVPWTEVDAVLSRTSPIFVGPNPIRTKANFRTVTSIRTLGPGSSPGRRLEIVDLIPRNDWLPADTNPILTFADWSPFLPPTRLAAATPKWSGSLWIAAREGSGTILASGTGQLGGSQAGGRVYRTLTPELALTGRLSTALAAKGAEASAGIALRHGPFAVLAERRFAIDSGGRNDWSLTAVAGVSDVRLPFGAQLDGYAQAGVVGRDGFADGALRIERPVFARGPSRLSLGAGVWGSIQPGVARLDVGPQIVARTSVASRPFRISAEWRQRVAGAAAPGSGLVLTLGADF